MSTVRVVSFGELLIDFVALERGVYVGNASGFAKKPGGAPANVAVGLAKLGIPTALMGQIGDDFFGEFLANTVAETGVDIRALRRTDKAMTALAFVAVEPNGERSFVFYRKPSADMLMTEADLDMNMLASTDIFHYGSITLIDDPVKSTNLAAIEHAKAHGALISYDPNLRPPLWPSLGDAKTGMLLGLRYANIVKISEEELEFLSGTSDIATGVRKIWQPDLKLMVVTKGEGGCHAFSDAQDWQVAGFNVTVEDTIGAGDGFVAGLLAGISDAGDDWLTLDPTPILKQANAVGAIATSRAGGIPSLPTRDELDTFLKNNA